MANIIEVEVPDIGDFKDVPVIDVLVSPGDRVTTEQPLITLESDKASMDVPSPLDGVVKEHQTQGRGQSLARVAHSHRRNRSGARRRCPQGEGQGGRSLVWRGCADRRLWCRSRRLRGD